jgi:hypothetical protein
LKTTTPTPQPPVRNPFVPLLILALAAMLFEGQDVYRLQKMRTVQAQETVKLETNAQAARNTDARIESLLLGLVRMAGETNMDARALVIKHGIQWTPPATNSSK